MPGRSTQQNLTNFEAISLRLELLAVVNAKLLFANIKSGRSALSLTAALRQERSFELWRILRSRRNGKKFAPSIYSAMKRYLDIIEEHFLREARSEILMSIAYGSLREKVASSRFDL